MAQPEGRDIEALSVSPRNSTLVVGNTQQLTAYGWMDSGDSRDVTTQVSWRSSNTAVATVAEGGMVTAQAVGDVILTAEMGALSATASLHITATAIELASITVEAPNPTLPVGQTMQYTATGNYSDGSHRDITTEVTWSVSNASATIDVGGLATGQQVGAAIVKAQEGALFGSQPVTVTSAQLARIEIDPNPMTIAAGFHQQARATAIYSDGSSLDVTLLAQWSTAQTATATVLLGHVHANAVGTTTLSAAFGSLTGSAPITVTAATLVGIEISPHLLALGVGANAKLTATGVFSDGTRSDLSTQVAWTSNALGTANVGPDGSVSTTGIGVAIITATKGTLSDSVIATVTAAQLTQLILPSTITLPVGRFADLLPLGLFSDGLTHELLGLTFASSDSSIASVSANGRITAHASGTVDITVTSGAITAVVHVTVTAALLESIAITPLAPVVARGAGMQLTATATYSDGTTMDVTAQGAWSTLLPSVATVSNGATRGWLTGVLAGATTVSVTVDSVTATTAVVVSPALLSHLVMVPGLPLTLPRGLKAPLVVIGHYTDGTTIELTEQVTWSSTAPSVATAANLIGSAGLVTAHAAGTATITATKGTASVSLQVTVTPAILDSILVQTPSILGLLQIGTATATGHYTDGTTVDLSSQVSWSSSSPLVASVTTGGSLLGLGLGGTTITATLGSIVGSGNVGVGNTCHLLVNEVKTGALLNSRDEWVEIYNPCSYAVDLSQVRVVYRGLLDTTDTILASPTGMLPAGGYRLYAGTGYTGGNADAVYTTDMGLGGVGIRVIATGELVDSVAFGLAANGLGEGALLGGISLGASLARVQDTDVNLVDFVTAITPTPRAANN